MVKERYDYADLKDMAEFFRQKKKSMALRIEVIKEICELSEVNVKWSRLDIKHLRYYAECPERIPADPWMFRRTLIREAKDYGVYLNEFLECG